MRISLMFILLTGASRLAAPAVVAATVAAPAVAAPAVAAPAVAAPAVAAPAVAAPAVAAPAVAAPAVVAATVAAPAVAAPAVAAPAVAAPAVAAPAVAAPAPAPAASAAEIADLLEFGVEMALKANWREARYRWERADAARPKDPRVLNNLAVSAEALGRPEEARSLYARALEPPGADYRIRENALRSDRFWRQVRQATGPETPPQAVPPANDLRQGKRKAAIDVELSLTVPARLDLRNAESLLVASFLVDESDLLDVNREIVRYMRGEFRKRTGLNVLDVTPAPAIPEQTIEDLVANSEFWKHLGSEYEASVIVSGALNYGRQDVSSFREVDIVDDRTGQKVRTTRFVEQEQFDFELEVFFFDGPTGGLLHRDRLRRSTVYRGVSNDPITAFYDLSATIAGDVLSVVSQSTRTDSRVLFKR